MALDFGAGISGIGGGIASLFSAKGDKASASGYDAAAAGERTNALISKASLDIQQAAILRDFTKSAGGQRSDVAGSGFKFSGSALDLARDTARQGALASSVTQAQGQIDIQEHTIQAQSYASQASAARSAATASTIGGFAGIAGGILSLFSDRRIKENIRRVGVDEKGLGMYEFTYKNDPTKTKWVGRMAQEVETIDPDAVTNLGIKMIDSKYAPERANAG